MTKRVSYFLNKNNEIVAQEEHLSKNPSGNAAQRQKAMRNGWKPAWIPAGQPKKIGPEVVLGATEEGIMIREDNASVAEKYSVLATDMAGLIDIQTKTFLIIPPGPKPCVLCGSLEPLIGITVAGAVEDRLAQLEGK